MRAKADTGGLRSMKRAPARPKLIRENTYTTFDPGREIGNAVSGLGRAIGGVPSAINAGRDALMGGQPSTVKRAMTKK